MTSASKTLVGVLEGKRQLVSPRCRWENDIISVNEICVRTWTEFVWLRKSPVCAVMNIVVKFCVL
jgi:hypothetical protein